LTRVKARVDLHTSNRARGLIQGRGRSLFKGSGEDFDDLKYYQPGDKISDIDWKATARSGEPLIRQFNEERGRHLSIVVDPASADSAWLLERAFRVTARPTLMTIITDEAHPTVEDFALLRRLTTRHDVIVIRIADADPLQGSALDDDVVDVDSPREIASLTRTSKRVARDVEAYRGARREGIAE